MFLTNFIKKNITGTSLFNGMTDVHTHLLPGVDDGVSTNHESFEVLSYMKGLGVKRIYLTPHIMSHLTENTAGILQEKFHVFKNNCPVDISFSLAAEYMLDERFPEHLKSGLLTFKDKHVLLETSYLAPPPAFMELIFEVVISGYQPILAHPERYIYMKEDDYNLLKEKGCKFQLNLFSLSGYYGKRSMINAKRLLKDGKYDFLGSDTHHLKGYKKGIQNCNLTSKEIETLQALLANNENL